MYESFFIVLFFCSTFFLLGFIIGYYIKKSENFPKYTLNKKLKNNVSNFGNLNKTTSNPKKDCFICCEGDI